MTCRKFAVWAFLLVGGSTLLAQADDDPPPQLTPLARLIGEWTVEGTWADGNPLKARAVYEWGVNHKIIKAKTFVRVGDGERQRYDSTFAWHPKRQCLYQISFALDGSISESVLSPVDADTLHIGYTPFDPKEPSKVRQILKFKDKDHFDWIVLIQQDGAWNKIMEATWQRKAP